MVRIKRPAGSSTVEFLLAFPIIIFFGFVCVQIGILWHAKFALTHAALIAARSASVSHGSDAAIRDGLIRGLLPLYAKTKELSSLAGGLMATNLEVAQGFAGGWLSWEVISPTRQSFMDWGQPADSVLSPGAAYGETEISFNGMTGLSTRLMPRSGISRWSGGLAVGSASEQTLLEANTLKLVLRAGIPLKMPIAGRLLARALALYSGCSAFWSEQKIDRVGLASFGSGADASGFSSAIECRALAARDSSGAWSPRWPLTVSATIQMQSNARASLMKLRDRQQSPYLSPP